MGAGRRGFALVVVVVLDVVIVLVGDVVLQRCARPSGRALVTVRASRARMGMWWWFCGCVVVVWLLCGWWAVTGG